MDEIGGGDDAGDGGRGSETAANDNFDPRSPANDNIGSSGPGDGRADASDAPSGTLTDASVIEVADGLSGALAGASSQSGDVIGATFDGLQAAVNDNFVPGTAANDNPAPQRPANDNVDPTDVGARGPEDSSDQAAHETDEDDAREMCEAAARWQEQDPRFGAADHWDPQVCGEGTWVFQMTNAPEPMQGGSGFFCDLSGAESCGLDADALERGELESLLVDAEALAHGLQTCGNNGDNKRYMLAYRVTADCAIATGQAHANGQYGDGGLTQHYIEAGDPETGPRLEYVGRIELTNWKGTGIDP